LRRNKWFALCRLILRLVLAGVFLTAALPKIQNPLAFAESIQAYQILSQVSSACLALTLPWLELVVGLGLLTKPLRRCSGIIIFLLLVIFIALHTYAWSRGLDISCGCFGRNDGSPISNSLESMLRNSALLLAISWIVIYDFKQADHLTD